MSYEALITPLRNVRPHPNGDFIALGNASGYQVIVSKGQEEGELGVLFPSDGALSKEMLRENNLYSKSELNKDPEKKGFFGKSGRVKAQNFRGEKSEAFWTTLGSLEWTGIDLSDLKEGDEFHTLNGKIVCQKYINPATLKAAHMQKKQGSSKKRTGLTLKDRFAYFREHFDTKHLKREAYRIPKNSIISLTWKIHGTSGRTGNLLELCQLTPGQKWWNKWMSWTGKSYEMQLRPRVVSGSRRVVLDPDVKTDDGWYKGAIFRQEIHQQFIDAGLPESLTVFYEIVGYQGDEKSIMGRASVEKIEDKKLRKALKKIYGKEITYSYGCEPGEYKVFVYRITSTLKDGRTIELPWPQVKAWCQSLGLTPVPEVRAPFIYGSEECPDQEALIKLVDSYLENPSVLDGRHPEEGICVRVEDPNGGTMILKHKSWIFSILEGVVKSQLDSIDLEEMESLLGEEDELA